MATIQEERDNLNSLSESQLIASVDIFRQRTCNHQIEKKKKKYDSF